MTSRRDGLESDPSIRARLATSSREQPYPIAAVCRRLHETWPEDPWRQWELLSRDLLGAVLPYLAHLVLSDLVATGHRPARLFHRIQSVLGRPLGGHYVGFLREAARLFRDEKLDSAFPELVDFLCRADVDCTLLPEGRAFLGLLVDYRNTWAHGKLDQPEAVREIAAQVAELSALLLDQLEFLNRHPLTLESGQPLIGSDPGALGPESGPLVVVSAGRRALRPLLVKLRGDDLSLLVEFDEGGKRLAYAGAASFEKLTGRQLKSAPAARLFQDLVDLQARVRALDADLPDWSFARFAERSAPVSDRTCALYEEMRKYAPAWYVPRPRWEDAEAGIFARFLASDRQLLALSGGQGSGKSALAVRFAEQARAAGHAVLFLNAQRFAFADVAWSGNPFPGYFARLLHCLRDLDRAGVSRLLESAPPGRQVVLVVDAVNEIDGLDRKWNRFRAMELLLQWIAAVAQPGLKVVVGFRIDIYEEYGYLRAGDPALPPDLGALARPGENPDRPWVVDVEALDEDQARRIYERLQSQPQLGMAPAFGWETIREGLGPRLAETLGNPLIFTTFLRIHHGEPALLATRREALFDRYARRLTGSDVAAQDSRWRRAAAFLRNGGVTPKEELLADLVDVMAEAGGPAILVERLDARKKSHRRLIRTLGDPQNRSFIELRDGGLLVEEKIEDPASAKSLRRLTTVAELLVQAMLPIERKRTRRRRLRHALLSIGVLWTLVPLILVGLLVPLNESLLTGAQLDGASRALGRSALISWQLGVAGLFLPFLVFFSGLFAARVLIDADPRPSPAAVGLIPAAVLRREQSHRDQLIGRSLLAPAVVWILGLGWILTRPETTALALLLPVVCLLTMLYAWAFNPGARLATVRRIGFALPLPVVRRAYAVTSNWLSSSGARAVEARNLRFLVYGALCALPSAGLLWILPAPAYSPSPAFSYSELLMAEAAVRRTEMLSEPRSDLIGLMLALAVALLLLLGPLVQGPGPRMTRRVFAEIGRITAVAPFRRPVLRATSVVALAAVLSLIPGLIADQVSRARRDPEALVRGGLPRQAMKLDSQGEVVGISIAAELLDRELVSRLERLPRLSRLEVLGQCSEALSLSALGRCKELVASASCLSAGDLPDRIGTLTLSDLERLSIDRTPFRLTTLKLPTDCDRELPPRLLENVATVELGVGCLSAARRAFEGLGTNAVVHLVDSGKSLDLGPVPEAVFARIPLLRKPVERGRERLREASRLWVGPGALDPALLSEASSLRWLVLRAENDARPSITPGTARAILALPQLETFEVVSPKGRFQSARGPDQVAALLQQFTEADPER